MANLKTLQQQRVLDAQNASLQGSAAAKQAQATSDTTNLQRSLLAKNQLDASSLLWETIIGAGVSLILGTLINPIVGAMVTVVTTADAIYRQIEQNNFKEGFNSFLNDCPRQRCCLCFDDVSLTRGSSQ